MFSLLSAWINGWVNNGEAGDLRRHPAHYDVIVMANVHTIIAQSVTPEKSRGRKVRTYVAVYYHCDNVLGANLLAMQ